MSSIALGDRITLAPDVLIQELAGESVLLNLNSEEYFGLDDIGTRMIAVLNESDSVAIAQAQLLAEYEVEPEHLSQDLLKLISDLQTHGLITITPAPPDGSTA
ncbi:PqqD family protein [Spirulina sp. CCNP1310]|uniref:PqqD family protein n=1 Tax=Spirulina sp. CCNP1310 TaxID=3110249 RepID=UPI002B1F0CBB|nr:PqqD family protein [Spirulina sp. CCNP1310]MEA5419807.1 PqqD family protein [Spirulina sp. CCNP1310]